MAGMKYYYDETTGRATKYGAKKPWVPAAAPDSTLVQLVDHCLHHMTAASAIWVGLNCFVTSYHLLMVGCVAIHAWLGWAPKEFFVWCPCIIQMVLLVGEWVVNPFIVQNHLSNVRALQVNTGFFVVLPRIVAVWASSIDLLNASSFLMLCFNILFGLFTTGCSCVATLCIFRAVRSASLKRSTEKWRKGVYRCRIGWESDYGWSVSTDEGNRRRARAILESGGGAVSNWQADYGMTVSPWDGDARRQAAWEAWHADHWDKLMAYKAVLADHGFLNDYGSAVSTDTGDERRRSAVAEVGPYDTFEVGGARTGSGQAKRLDVEDVVRKAVEILKED